MKNLLLIHGAIGAAEQMFPLKDSLSNDYNVSIIEFDGHGSKSHLSNPFTISHFKQQLESELTLNGEAHIFGYSMGGFIALLAAADGNPLIKSIFTLGTKMEWNEEIAAKECAMLNSEKIEEKVPVFANALAKRHGTAHWKSVLNKTASLLTEIGQKQPINASSIGSIQCPIHLCLADQDTMVSEEETKKVEIWTKNASFSKLVNSKHPIEQVDLPALSAKIRDFIESV